MTRWEWSIVLALSLLTVVALSFAPPLARPPTIEAEAVTRVGQPSSTITPATATRPISTTPALTTTILFGVTRTLTATPALTTTRLMTNTASLTVTRPLTVTVTQPMTATPTLTATQQPTFTFNTHPELSRYIFADQGTQHMYVFEKGELLRDIPCSSGLPDDDKYTPAWEGKVGYYAGTFFSFGTWADNAWYLYMSQGAILVHSLPYTMANDVKVYQDRDALGVRPSSHGCIRISPEDAGWLTEWNPEGVLMTVTDPYLERWREK